MIKLTAKLDEAELKIKYDFDESNLVELYLTIDSLIEDIEDNLGISYRQIIKDLKDVKKHREKGDE